MKKERIKVAIIKKEFVASSSNVPNGNLRVYIPDGSRPKPDPFIKPKS